MAEIEKYRKEKKRAENKGNVKEAAQICNFIGELLAKQGRYEEAVAEHEQELFLSEASGDRLGAGVAHRKIGECYCEMGRFEEAIKHQAKHLQAAQAERDDVEIQRAFATVGRTYLFQVESTRDIYLARETLKRAKTAFERSLEFCEKLKSRISVKDHAEMKARLLLNLGLVYEQRADMKKCTELIKQAITISETHALKEDVFRCQISLAGIHQRHGSYSQAIRLYDAAYKYAQSTRDQAAETDVFTQKTLIFLQLGDFFAAQRSIKKAYKINAAKTEEKERLGHIFKTVIFMGKTMEKLNTIPEREFDQRMPIYEKMGDAAAQIGNFKQAIKCYQNMLKCGLALGKAGAALIPVYVSLAQTYMDDKQYAKACEYFHKELECRAGDSEQMSRTWLNIADAEELGGETYDQVLSSYLSAMECAKAAGHHKLQATVLKSLSLTQGNYKREEAREETLEQLRALRERHELLSDEELSDTEEPSQDAVPEDEVDLDEYLSDSDVSENEEYDRTKMASGRVARRKTKSQVKRNEKGETPLHRACIDGDLKKVKALISQGHPMNPRDYCGWIPLHEAANHDHVQIVEALLGAGAWINDRGGQHCGGVTPLHDACSCGNVRVIELLVSRGANVHAKDNNGNTVLDSLMEYMARSEGLLSRQDMDVVKTIEKLLRNTMRGNNPHLSGSLTQQQSKTQQLNNEADDISDLPTLHRRQRRSVVNQPLTSTQITDSGPESPALVSDHEEEADLEESVIREYERSETRSSSQDTRSSQSEDLSDAFRRRNKRSRNMIEEEEEECEEAGPSFTPSSRPDLDLPCLDDASSARGVYQNVIASMRRSAVSAVQPVRGPSQSGARGPALVNDDGGYVGDDWLIDDLRVTAKPAKRKRVDASDLFTTTGTRRTSEANKKRRSREEKQQSREERPKDSTGDDSRRTFSENSRNAPREVDMADDFDQIEDFPDSDPLIEPLGDNEVVFLDEPDHYFVDNNPAQYSPKTPIASISQQSVRTPGTSLVSGSAHQTPSQSATRGTLSKKPRQTTLTNFGMTSQVRTPTDMPVPCTYGSTMAASQAAPPLVRPVMRLKVKIKDKCILVPIPSAERTISWLSEEAAQRYYKLYNMRPLLSIATRDGAVLSPEDPVSFILADNEEVEGQVQSWDLPPLPNRYVDACTVQKTVMYRNVQAVLTTAVTTQSLALTNLALRPTQFVPICKALQCQYLLKELNLQGNRLGNDGFSSLCGVLSTLPSLSVLNVSANQISDSGLKSLSAILEKGMESTEKPLKVLEKLDLGYNSLGDGSTQSLTVVVRHLPALTSLSLTSCDLTVRFFQQHRIALAEALQDSQLHHLELAHNLLGATGVELLLRCVRPQMLRSLGLSGVLSSYTTNHFHKHLYAYMLQPACVLSRLVLDNCYLLPEHWPEITGLVSKSRTLEHLSLSANPKLSNGDVVEVLEAAVQSELSQLEVLVFTGCNIQGPLSTAFIDALNDKLSHARPLRHVAFTCRTLSPLDRDTLSDIWTSRWADDAQCSFVAGKVVLSTADFRRL